MRVLYANHTGLVSGAERSLLELLAGLPEEVSPIVACPTGNLAKAVLRLGVRVTPIPAIDASLRVHPYYSSHSLLQIGRAATGLLFWAKRSSAQLIHANTIRAGLAAVLTAKLGGPPVVVHLRDCLPSSRIANLSRRFISSGASLLIANSLYTATSFTRGHRPNDLLVIYNPVDLDRFSPNSLTRDEARQHLGLDGAYPVLGVVGQLAPWKAYDDAIRILSLLRSTWPSARLLVVGTAVFTSKAARYNNLNHAESLRRLADSLGLDGSVRFLGEREDVPKVLRALDLLLVPSWEEPFGRSVIEAMAMEVPVVATSVGGPAEIIDDGRNGVLVAPRQPDVWAAVITRLVSQPGLREAMGRQGRMTTIRRFGVSAHVKAILNAYRQVLGDSSN